MPKKDFSKNPALAYMESAKEQSLPNTPSDDTEPIKKATGRKPKGEYYRVCLNLRPEFRQYLDEESWKSRKNVTEYINDLIAADMETKQANE